MAKTGRRRGPGRGWHGDPEGHARAGRKGGRARKKSSGRKGGNSSSGTGFFGMGE
jgi:hypothetical protein